MHLTNEERDARNNNKLLLGVGHAGIENLSGPVVSCSVAIDYTKVSPKLIDMVLGNKMEKSIFDDLKSAIKVINIYEIDTLKLNDIADTTIATYLADYHALYGCVFEIFHKFSTDPDVVISEMPIKEVVQNRDLSIYNNKNAKSNYIVMKDWTQFDNLIPNTKFVTKDPQKVFTLLFAKACANTRVLENLKKQKSKYPDYDFETQTVTEELANFLTKHGLTEFHRGYLPELSKFAFNKHILI
jgi:hypothetical protein